MGKLFKKSKRADVNMAASDSAHKLKMDMAAMRHLLGQMTLEKQLDGLAEGASNVLQAHNLPYSWPDVLHLPGQDIPYDATYAAQILAYIHGVRTFVKKGEAENAASEALRLGGSVASLQAELVNEARTKKRTSAATEKRQSVKELRQGRMKAIAEERGWQPGDTLRKKELAAVYVLLRERHPEYRDKPNDETLSRDAKDIGLRD